MSTSTVTHVVSRSSPGVVGQSTGRALATSGRVESGEGRLVVPGASVATAVMIVVVVGVVVTSAEQAATTTERQMVSTRAFRFMHAWFTTGVQQPARDCERMSKTHADSRRNRLGTMEGEQTVRMPEQLIVVVEDEPDLVEVVVAYLRRANYRVLSTGDGETAVALLASMPPDLIVLDVNLPGIDGFETLRRIRASSKVPVLMLTARVDEVDRVSGFRLGADDYVTKPFSPHELVERVHAILRRARPLSEERFATGRLEVDTRATRVTVDETTVALTAAEYHLLHHFIRHPRHTFTRSQLRALVFPNSEAADRVIDAHIGNLRRKLIESGLGVDHIVTVRGIGYRFEPAP
jgi:two-component system, OmpR family, response regulator AdeR